MKDYLKKILQFIVNPRFLLCFGLAWIITNGWSYVLLGLGTWLRSPVMVAIAGTYLTFLWFPFTAEKIITFSISIALMEWLFPNDKQTLGTLHALLAKAKDTYRAYKEKRRARRVQRRQMRRNRCAL